MTGILRRHWLAIAVFALLAFIVLHTILFHNGTHVAGFDYFNYNWNFWWIRHALTTPGLNVYENDFVFFPAMSNYGYHALSAFWFPLWALIEPFTGTLTAMNVIIVVACFLNGYMLFLLLRRWGVRFGLALIGGAALQITPLIRYFYYNTHINLMDWFWLPIHLLLWHKIVDNAESGQRRGAAAWAILQGSGLWGVLHSDLQFPIFVAFLFVPYTLFTLWRSHARLRLIAAGLLATLTAVTLAWFAGPLPYILKFEGDLAPSPVENRPGIPFPRGYFSVDAVWWHWNTPTLGGFVTVLLLISLAVSLSPMRRTMRPIRWLWFWLLLPPLILSLGPTIIVFGSEIQMPFRLLYRITNGMFGMPWRLAPIYLIAALLFIGLTWSPLMSRLSKARRVWIMVGLFLALFASVRLFQSAPLDPAPYPYEFYETMGNEPYDEYVVLEVPTAVGTGEILVGDSRAIQYQFYGMTHHKRMVNGFISRAPVENFWYVRTDDPLLSWLGQRRLLEPELVEPQLREMIPEWPLGYIVVHQGDIGRDTVANQEIIGYFNSLDDLLCPVFYEHDAVVYRTAWHPDGCPPRTPPEIEPGIYQIDIGAPGDEFFTGWGWHFQENVGGVSVRWTGRWDQADVYVDLPPEDYKLTIMAQAFHEPRDVTLTVNGEAVDTVAVSADRLQPITFEIPAGLIGDGEQVDIGLIYDGMLSPAEAGIGEGDRQLALMIDWMRFERQP